MPMGVVVLDREYRFRRWNAPWLEFVRFHAIADPAHIAVGVRYFDVFADTEARLRPALDRVLAGETIARQAVEVMTPAGPTYWDIVMNPLVEHGEISGTIQVATDVTGQVKGRQLIDEHHAQYRAVFEAATDALFITTLDGRIIEVNPAASEMTGYSHDELLELSPYTLIDPEFHPRIDEYFDRLIAQHIAAPGRARALRKDGGLLDVQIHGTVFLYGGEQHLLSIVRDVSEERRAMALLQQRVDEQTRELRTLLEISRSLSSTIKLGPLLDTIIEQLRNVVPYELATIILREREELVVLDTSDEPGSTQPGVRYPISLLRPAWDAISNGRSLLIGDIREQNPVADCLRAAVAFGRGEEVASRVRGSWMGVPVRVGDEVLGAMTLATREPYAYSTANLDLLGAVASQAGAAIDNARLYAQTAQRVAELESLTSVAANLTLFQPLEELLQVVAATAASTTRAMASLVALVDPDSGRVTLSATEGVAPEHREMVRNAFATQQQLPAMAAVAQRKYQVELNARQKVLDAVGEGPLYDALATQEWNALCSVPLLFQGQPLGVLNCYFPGDTAPSEDEIAYYTALADQAAVGIRNAQLLQETERRVREATALARIASSLAFDRPLRETLDALASNVADATGAVASTVTLLEPQTGRHLLSGVHNVPHDFVLAARDAVAAGAPSPAHAAMRSRKQVVVPDARSQVLASVAWAPVHPFVEVAEWEAEVSTPIVYRNRELGSVDVYFRDGDLCSEDDLPFLQAMADQIASAAENVNLFAELDQRVKQVEAVASIAATLTFAQPMEEMLQTLAENIVDSTAVIGCAIGLYDESADSVQLVASHGLPGGYIQAINDTAEPSGPSTLRKALETRKPVVIPDQPATLLSDDRYLPAHEVLRAANWRTVVVVPTVYHGEGRGAIAGYYPPEATPGQADVAFLSSIADQAAVAIENSRLFERAQSLAAVEERQRLARELHDSVSQALYGIGLGARTASDLLDVAPERAREPVDYVLSLAEAGLAEMRALIFELRPESLATEGLVEAFMKQAASMRARHGIEVDAILGAEPEIPLELKEALYRIGKEALHNTVKHARATHVRLELGSQRRAIVLSVADNGGGFNPVADFPGHLGLKSMRERTEQLGGRFTLESAPGKGTRIRVSIPVGG